MVTNPACCVAVGVGRHYKMLPENLLIVAREELKLMNQFFPGHIVQL